MAQTNPITQKSLEKELDDKVNGITKTDNYLSTADSLRNLITDVLDELAKGNDSHLKTWRQVLEKL